MKKIVIAPDSFKETFSSLEASYIIRKEFQKKYDYNYICVPIADGGEGSIDAIKYSNNMKIEEVKVTGPNMERVTGRIGLLNKNEVIVECANIVGFQNKIKSSNPGNTTTYGIGELIKYAIEKGYKKVYVCMGGTITNDAGVGILDALGAKFYNKNDEVFHPVGDTLIDIDHIDLSNFNKNIEVVMLSDVTNPLYGPNGASYIFSKQKGATDEQIKSLDDGLIHFSKVTEKVIGKDLSSEKGSGAAGGIGYALRSYLNASYESGISAILKLIKFDEIIKNADLIITGEGKIDYQSACGKTISGVIKYANNYNIPVIAIVGLMDGEIEEYKKLGLIDVYPTSKYPRPIEEIKKTCVSDMENLIRKIEI